VADDNDDPAARLGEQAGVDQYLEHERRDERAASTPSD